MTSNDSPQNNEELQELIFELDCRIQKICVSCPDLQSKLGSSELRPCQNTCLTMSFLNFPEIELCMNDNQDRRKNDSAKMDTCGKTCIFSLTVDKLEPFLKCPVSPCSFCVKIKIFLLDPCNNNLEVDKPICSCYIPLGVLFSRMLYIAWKEGDVPVTCCASQDYPLMNVNCVEVGTMSACLRLTCFGALLVSPSRNQGSSTADGSDKMTDCSGGLTDSSEDDCMRNRRIKKIDDNDLDSKSDSDEKAPSTVPDGMEDWMKGLKCTSSKISTQAGDLAPWKPPNRCISEPEVPVYEEIRAVINGHTLFFKILKKMKKSRQETEDDGPAGQVPGGLPALEARKDEPRDSGGKRADSRVRGRGSLKQSDDVPRAQSKSDPKEQERMEPDAYGAYPPNTGKNGYQDDVKPDPWSGDNRAGYRVNAPWDDQLKELDDPDFVFAPGANSTKLEGPGDAKDKAQDKDKAEDKEKALMESKSKEVFSISVGKQFSTDGEIRPKLVLEIRAPKTKEDLDAEEALIDAVEDRMRRREEKKKARDLVADGTQYAPSDFGGSEVSDGESSGGGKGKGKGKGKGGKGKRGKGKGKRGKK